MSSHMKTKKLKKANAGMVVKPTKPAMDTASTVKAPVVAKAKKPMTSGGLPLYDKKGNIIYQKKKGGSAKAMPKAMYGKSIMKKGGAKKK